MEYKQQLWCIASVHCGCVLGVLIQPSENTVFNLYYKNIVFIVFYIKIQGFFKIYLNICAVTEELSVTPCLPTRL